MSLAQTKFLTTPCMESWHVSHYANWLNPSSFMLWEWGILTYQEHLR